MEEAGASDIKTMKLYGEVARVFKQLAQEGYQRGDAVGQEVRGAHPCPYLEPLVDAFQPLSS